MTSKQLTERINQIRKMKDRFYRCFAQIQMIQKSLTVDKFQDQQVQDLSASIFGYGFRPSNSLYLWIDFNREEYRILIRGRLMKD